MKTSLLSALFWCLISITSYAQKSSVKGTVIDTISNNKLSNTTISILRAKDSILVKFARTNENGAFTVNDLPNGKLFVLITYPGYADYVEQFNLDSIKKDIDFGQIKLTLKATLLANVIIKGKAAAIKIKGDTTEFNAGSYVIQPNSKVEDLLKQLPGIEVDRNGKITAQGKTVTRVLVDGEEFFGDDPTLVTKNIRGDMVDKVQLYDKKSDQATFTGIDDDRKEKTINIKLKEDKKNGYFGKLDGGIATDDYYQGQAMFNAFKNKRKVAAFGTLGNTGKIGLGWEDNNKYGSQPEMEFGDDGSMMFRLSNDDDLDSFGGQYNGEGLPSTRNGGAHYDAKWNSDKESINANYKLGSINIKNNTDSRVQNTLPAGIQNTNSEGSSENFMFKQKLDAIYQIKLDSTANLKISADGTVRKSNTDNLNSSRSFNGENTPLNDSETSSSSESRNEKFNTRIFWTKKLKKKGRTLSLNVNYNNDHKDSDGFLKSKNTFYKPEGTTDSITNQYKKNTSKNSLFGANIAYTELLAKKLSLILNYGLGINNSSAENKSFNQAQDGSYSLMDNLYSNYYKLDQLSNQGGVILNYGSKKTNINLGTKISNVNYDQENVYHNTSFKRNFLNWNPQASVSYNISQQQSLRLNYNGNTNQPSIEQINPLRDNTDPLNIVLGNPDLKPSFNNNLDLSYYSYKVFSGQNISVSGNYSFTSNPIVNNTQTDSVGKSIYQTINIDQKAANYYFFGSFSKDIKSIGTNVGINTNINGNTSYSYLNNELNKSMSNSYTSSLTVTKYKERKYEIRLSFGPTYRTNSSSLKKNNNDNGWGFNGDGNIGIFLPFKIDLTTDATYEYRAKTQSFDSNFERIIWNARINKKFLKTDNLKLSLSMNNLLNQNNGFNRSAYGNMIVESNRTTIRRYTMLSVVWDFNRMGDGPVKK